MDRITKCKQGQQIEKEIYLYYVRYIKKHGYAPSYKEAAEYLNLSTNTIGKRVRSMIEKGLFRTDHPEESRAVTVVGFEFRLTRSEKRNDV